MSSDMNPRTCVVTRTEKSPDEMIRFVLDPQNRVVPDLKRKLPGRGVWVTAHKQMIEEAIAKDHFQRGFKAQVVVDYSLTQLIEDLFKQSTLGLLGLARKSGSVVTGQAKANDAVRAGAASIVLHATDAANDGTKKLDAAIRSLEEDDEEIPSVFKCFSSDELDAALGNVNTMHLAILSGGIAENLEAILIKLNAFQEIQT